jgi:TRAP-type mannitol/chloroaromatic compound transport system permease small subunit
MQDVKADAVSSSVVGRITAILAAIGTGWILVIMVLICADVIGRGAFNRPILGVPELVQFSIVGIVFLQLPETLRTGGLTRSDVLLGPIQRRLPRLGHAMEMTYQLVGLVLCVIIVLTTWPLMLQAFQNAEFYGSTGVIQVPTGPLKCIIMLGAGVMALELAIGAVTNFRAMIGSAKGLTP